MLLYTAKSRVSMLLPNGCDPSWTDLSRVFSDNVPQPAGIGAAQIAQQALGLSPGDAANLVAAAGASTVDAGQLSNILGRLGTTPTPAQQAANAVRVPIPASVNTTLPLINGDPRRTFILIQNNNGAGGANLLVSVDGAIQSATPAFYLNLGPGLGILLDEEVFGNPIYVAWAAGTVSGGMVLFGSTPPPPAPSPYGNIGNPNLH